MTALRIRSSRRWFARLSIAAAAALSGTSTRASDHLDSPSVIADPRTDIGDLYGWMTQDGKRLNLVMTVVGHTFSDKVDYVFHIDSARRFGGTDRSIDLTCRFRRATVVTCVLGQVDQVAGDPTSIAGLVSGRGRFKVFAGARDDPFFNNVRGTRAMYDVATAALAGTARYDGAGCPRFDAAQTSGIADAWAHTDGGPPTNFLRGWWPAAIVVSIDRAIVSRGGPLLGIWAATVGPAGQIDRAARPLTGNALLMTLGDAKMRDAMKEDYNRSRPADGARFVAELAKGVALYDGLDGRCGDGLLIDRAAPPARRYLPLARLLADDRLWIDARGRRCTELFAVERVALNRERRLGTDCGGRTVDYDAVNVYRSLIASGKTVGVDDGVHHDEMTHSTTAFPFLAAPDPAVAGK